MKQKQFEVDLKLKELESTDDVIKLEGWANKFVDDTGQIFADRDNEAVVPYGIDIEEYKENPIILYQHRKDEAIGKCTSIEVSEKGIYVACEIYRELHPVAFAAIKRGVLKSFSIGFKVIDAVYDNIRNLWLLVKSTLLEISLVSIPSNRLSTFSIVKSEDGKKYLSYVQDTTEDILDNIFKEIQLLKTQVADIIKATDKFSESSETKLKEVGNTIPTLEEQFTNILNQVTPDNFEVAYAFYEKLQERLNNTLNSALAQS